MPSDAVMSTETNAETGKPIAARLPQEQPIAVAAGSGLVSILVPCCGQLEYTKLCVASVLRFSRKPFELIFLDVGSLDGTREFIAGAAVAAGVRIESVRTPTDQGIGDAVQDA